MLFLYISCFIESLLFLYITKKFVNERLNFIPYDILEIVGITLIGSTSILFPVISWACGQLILFIYGFLAYPKEKFHGILAISCTFLFTSILQLLCVPIINLTPIGGNEDLVPIIGNTLTLIFAIIILNINIFRSLYQRTSYSKLPYQFIFVNIYVLILMMILYFKLNPTDLYLKAASSIIIILVIICINIFLLYYDQRLQLREQEVDHYKKELPVFESLISDIRATQHEYSNHIQRLQFLSSTCHTYKELSNALNEYTHNDVKVMRAYPLLNINMHILAASLYSLYLRAYSQNIIVRFNVTSEKLTSDIPEMKLCDYTTILLQNAIEACNPGDSVYVYMCMEDGKLHFETRNKIDKMMTQKEIDRLFEINYSTKRSRKPDGLSHGLGLYYLLSQMKEIDNTVSCFCVNNEGEYLIIFAIDV